MEIFAIRHTAPNIEKGICYGQSDIDVLPNEFAQQLPTILHNLPLHAEAIFTSPLQRCTVLAKQIINASNTYKHYITDDRLLEMNFGRWELKAWNDLPEEETKDWMNDYVNVCVPNGENFVQLYNRVVNFITQQKKQHQKIIVVTHAGVIRSMLCYANQTPLLQAFNYHCTYGEIIKIIV